jgi:predicted nucleic acid-binding protein
LTVYLDTSVIVPLLVPEPMSPVVDRWLAGAGDAVTTSRWAVIELHSAVGMKVRAGHLDPGQGSAVLHALATKVLPSLALIEVEPGHMTAAAGLLGQLDLGLRAGDALHLAMAHAASAAALVTFDHRLCAASRATGLDAMAPA